MNIFFTCLILFSIFFLSSQPVTALVLPRFRTAPKVSNKNIVQVVGVSARLRPDRQALLVTFNNVAKASSLSYTLTYQSDGMEQGVSGSVDSSQGNVITRELLFGTCSSGVCHYHQNLSAMRFEVSIEYPNGKRVIKKFRVKV